MSGKIDKYEYLTSKEILPSDQSIIIGQAKFTHSPLGKAFEKQTKTIEDQAIKQVEALKALKPKENWELESKTFSKIRSNWRMVKKLNEKT